MAGVSGIGASVFGEFCAAGLWPGVSGALAATLAEAGIRGPSAVTEKALAELPGVTEKRARTLYSAWIGAHQSFELATLLLPRGLPIRWVRRLTAALGEAAAATLAADPWQVLALPDAQVAQADSFARALQPDVSPADPRRLRALVVRTLTAEAREGHTLCPAELVAADLARYGLREPQHLTAALQAAVDAELARRIDGDLVALETLAKAEDAIAHHLARLHRTAKPLVTAAAAKKAGKDLDRTQRGAVAAAVRHGVSLLTGGPGTGKSRTVTAVVLLCRDAGAEIALAAPTGRAAKRLTELLVAADAASGQSAAAEDAVTIHRLLGARPGPGDRGSVFEFDASNPISADMVVIDETSMLDVELAAALLSAIPDGAHLLLVGDPAQLPSIGPGRVLGDILAADRFPATELTTLYRQSAGGAIARLAAAVRGGELLAPDEADREVVVVPAAGSDAAAHRVTQLVTDSIPRVFGLETDQIQVVTPVHRGPAGTEALNTALKKAINPGPHRGHRTLRGFDVGDRVVATANHFDAEPTGYANGEIGTVIDTGGSSVLVAFPGGEAEISGKALGDLLHGWAITVHRAQGSEWEAVVAVLPPEAGRMLSRPLVYTALTRARVHLSVVHAAGGALAHAVRQVGARPRRTRLATLLPESPAPSE